MRFHISTSLLILTTALTLQAQSSWLDYDQVLSNQVWLRTNNAAMLSTYHPADSAQRLIADACLGIETQHGHFIPLNESPHAWTIHANARSICRLSRRVVMRGDMNYSRQWGSDAGGSIWIQPSEMPFDITEYDDSTTGNIQIEKYHLNGEIGVNVCNGLSLGTRFDYTAATGSKQKDPRHTNSLMCINTNIGTVFSTAGFTGGAAYLLQRSTESVQFRTYGRTDRVYHYLIDFGALYGRDETTDGKGYTSNDNEKPLLDMRHGLSLQAGYTLKQWTLAVEWQWLHRHGHYGIESPAFIDFNKHQGNSWQVDACLQHATTNTIMQLSFNWQRHNLRDYERTYSSVTNAGVTDIVYFDDRLMSIKQSTSYRVTADAQWGINRHLATWAVKAMVNHERNNIRAIIYPYYRLNDTHLITCTLSATRNWLSSTDRLWAVTLKASWATGGGNMATDLTFGTPAEGNKAPTSPSIQASRLFQWLTASRAGASVMLRHAFNVTHSLRLYADASYGFTAASKIDNLADSHMHRVALSLGCLF